MLPVIYSDEFLKHETGRLHPERPQRLTAIVEALQAVPWADQIEWHQPTPVTARQDLMPMLQQVHSQHHLERVREVAEKGGGFLDADTPVSADSYQVALLAASAWMDGIDKVLAENNPAFVLARPPGHHAERNHGMGFCLFSNAAIAAYYALIQPEIKRVAILDWDVHHGNGTQDIVENRAEIAYCSLHQSPCYPGTGFADERGGYNNVLNIPISPNSTVTRYQEAFDSQVMPFLQQFQPDLLIVSAGYDANAADPLASVSLQPEDFGLFTEYALKITRRVLFGLEGGYALPELAQSVTATIGKCL